MTLDTYAVKAGTSSRVLLLHGRSRKDPTLGASGLRHDTPGAVAAYVREGEAQPHRIQLAEGLLGKHAPGSFVEVDPELLPGVYQFGAPDEMLAPGSARAVLVLRFPEAVFEPVEIDLVAYDPQDSVRLGMSAISSEARVAALRGAFPRLTERELRIDRELGEPE
jgi:hypothetical protein